MQDLNGSLAQHPIRMDMVEFGEAPLHEPVAGRRDHVGDGHRQEARDAIRRQSRGQI